MTWSTTRGDPMPMDALSGAAFDRYLDGLPDSEYLSTHRLRYRETWARAAPFLADRARIVELGAASPLADYLARAGRAVATITCDLRMPWPLADAAADAVLSLEVLEHLSDTPAEGDLTRAACFDFSGARTMFAESRRILAADGVLLLTTPNATGIDAIGRALSGRHPFLYAPHVREYAPADVLALAAEAGFRPAQVSTFFAWGAPPGVDRASLLRALGDLGFDMADRGDDLFIAFRRA